MLATIGDHAAQTIDHIRSLSDGDLVVALSDSIHSFEIQRAHALALLGEFDARGLARVEGAPNPAVWLATFAGQSRRSAEDYRTVARRLRRWPRFLERYLQGDFTYSIVRLALRFITEDNHDEVLELALTLTHEQLLEALSGRPNTDEEGAARREYFNYRVDDEGWLKGNISLDPANAAIFLAALKIAELAGLRDLGELEIPDDASPQDILKLLNDTLSDASDDDNAVPTTEDEEADQDKPYQRHLNPEDLSAPLSQETWMDIERKELQRGGEADDQLGVWEDDGGPARPEPELSEAAANAQPASKMITRFGPPTARTRLMALLNLGHMARTTPRSTVRAPGAEIHLIIGPDGQPRLPNHLGADAAALIDMIFNGTLRYHVQDKNGNIIKTGSRTRVIPAAVEEAVLVTWNYQCGTPGCTNCRYLQLHHIEGFAKGGPTEIPNLIALCSGCHSLVTDGIITIHVDEHDPSLVHFRFPGGRSFTAQRRGLAVRNPDASPSEPYREGPVPNGDEKLFDGWDFDDLSFDDIA